jgi:tetratricopeptide (TPR) repeat protein
MSVLPAPRSMWLASKALVGSVALVILSGCASLSLPAQDVPLPQDLPRSIELTAVPFLAQAEYQCGPAALATVLTHAGAPRSPEQLVSQVYLPAREGSLQPELLGATRRAGRLPYVLTPHLQALLRELAAGNPVLVLQNLRFSWWPQWHYAVVVGYHRDTREVILRSGTEKRLVMDLDAFDRSWQRAGRWSFVVMRPGAMPASVQEASYLDAAASLERVDVSAASAAYHAAVGVWPDNLAAHVGLGNIAYSLGWLTQARDEYKLAARAHPESGDAWNNLAQTQLDMDDVAQALDSIMRAVAIGGPRLKVYEATRSSVLARKGQSKSR